MNTSPVPAAGMADEDIYAFSPVPQPLPPAPRPRRSRWPWMLLVVVLATSLMALIGAMSLIDLLGSRNDGMDVSINADHWGHFFVGPEHAVLGLLGLAAALCVVLMVVPVVVLLVLVIVTLVVALALGSGLLAVLVVVTVALSPLWLLGLLIWLLVRRKPAR